MKFEIGNATLYPGKSRKVHSILPFVLYSVFSSAMFLQVG